MAYGEYYVERQGWAHWPKTLIMCRKRGDGIERRRYVPETELQMTRDELREECQCADMAEMKLLHHMGVFESVKDTNADLRRMLHEKDAENAELRKELEQWHKLTERIELPEYPLTEFQPKDLERENAKLRELVHMMLRVAGIAEYATDAEWQVIARYLSKLKIEVDE